MCILIFVILVNESELVVIYNGCVECTSRPARINIVTKELVGE